MSECPGITSEQLKTTNGCGSSAWYAWIFRIPKWFSHEIWCLCNCHDLKFQDKIKRSLIDKWAADDKLYDGIYYVAFHSPKWLKPLFIQIAEITYWCLSTRISEWCWHRAKRDN